MHNDASCGTNDVANFLQAYVRDMNNEIFLSQHQLNALYALLLIGRDWPWEQILQQKRKLRPSSPNFKQEIDGAIKLKIQDVQLILAQLLMMYEKKIKESNLNWLQKFMTILKAKTKSIYVERVYPSADIQQPRIQQEEAEPENSERDPFDSELLSIFLGISNVTMLMGTGLGQFVEHNASERYITVKMGKKFHLTIKNDDPQFYDNQSRLRNIPKELFTHHIFQYINASELFQKRLVCKEWNEYVREAWHSVFKRQMLSQLLASEFCKQIELHFKILQLRNPFYQKLSLLIHALIEIIQWDSIYLAVENNTVQTPLTRVIMTIMKMIGMDIPIKQFSDMTPQLWQANRLHALNLKEKIMDHINNLGASLFTVKELKTIKRNILDHPFMRVEEMGSEDKNPLLLLIFLKQFTLQSIIKNHILLTQEYLMNTKRRLDEISKMWPQNKGFLQKAYKVLLLRTASKFNMADDVAEDDSNNMPDYSSLLRSVFEDPSKEFQKPDFVIKTKYTVTNVYLDHKTKLQIVINTYNKAMRNSHQQAVQQNPVPPEQK